MSHHIDSADALERDDHWDTDAAADSALCSRYH
jgi:hypothetical protein